jgi:hypothetical protein
MEDWEQIRQRNARFRNILFWVLLGLAIVILRTFLSTPFA